MNTKIAYLGKIQLSDIDLSYLHEAQKLHDTTYFVELNPRFMQGPGYHVKQLYPHTGIFPALEAYPELARLSAFIDTDKFFVVNTCGTLWPLKSFWLHLQLVFFLLRRHFSVVHLVWPPNIYEAALYLLRRRMVLTVHDPFVHTGNDSFIVRLRRKAAFRLVPQLVILNEAQREMFITHYRLKPGQVSVGTIGCYTSLHTIKPDLSTLPKADGTTPRYILFSGKMSPYKGLDYLLEAMTAVHSQCPDCRLIVAGGGDIHFDISRYASLPYIEIRNRFIPEEELVALIAHASFMVCPYTDATQSGVVMSAFSFSRPVIVTDVGGLPEMVKDGRHGLVVKEKDSAELAQAIVRLWKDEALNETFVQNIRHDCTTGQPVWERAAEQMSAIYSKVENKRTS